MKTNLRHEHWRLLRVLDVFVLLVAIEAVQKWTANPIIRYATVFTFYFIFTWENRLTWLGSQPSTCCIKQFPWTYIVKIMPWFVFIDLKKPKQGHFKWTLTLIQRVRLAGCVRSKEAALHLNKWDVEGQDYLSRPFSFSALYYLLTPRQQHFYQYLLFVHYYNRVQQNGLTSFNMKCLWIFWTVFLMSLTVFCSNPDYCTYPTKKINLHHITSILIHTIKEEWGQCIDVIV